MPTVIAWPSHRRVGRQLERRHFYYFLGFHVAAIFSPARIRFRATCRHFFSSDFSRFIGARSLRRAAERTISVSASSMIFRADGRPAFTSSKLDAQYASAFLSLFGHRR